MRDLFLLDPDVTFLNHGSFGACPADVFQQFRQWQDTIERQPVAFMSHRYQDEMNRARADLAVYVNCPPDDLIFVTNATAGLNIVARSLDLMPDDEILTTTHEYGALDRTWDYVCQRSGATYIRHDIALPLDDETTFIEAFWEQVTPRTRVIFLSHITSPTALTLPVAAICERARAAGILTIIDGAHVPGQLDLDLNAIGADFYSGNCHKWLCAPRGSAFLYARPEHHDWLDPLVISWGWQDNSSFVERNQWQGTRDVSAFLSVPAAIQFQADHAWQHVRQRCHDLAVATQQRLLDLFNSDALSTPAWFAQMVAVPLPPCDAATLKQQLLENYHIEVPIITWQGHNLIRVSFQGYNTQADADHLVTSLKTIFSDTHNARDADAT